MAKPSRSVKREADRAFQRFNERGCCRCGHKPMPGVLEVLVRGPGRTLLAIHKKCAHENERVLSVATFLADDPHIARDRKWFDANPSRLARLRKPYDSTEIQLLLNRERLAELRQFGEAPQSDATVEALRKAKPEQIAVLVVRRAEGVRLRFVTTIKCDVDTVPLDVTEELGAALLAQHVGLEIPTREQFIRHSVEAQSMELSHIASAITGMPSVSDVARAAGEALKGRR